MSAKQDHPSPEVRAAISAFLNDSRGGDQTFDVSEAVDAVRRVFPSLEASDAELIGAITSEASTAGFDIHYEADGKPKALERKALQRWDNEGGL